MYLEQLVGMESNDAAREALLRGLAAERPAAAMIVGDIVCFGASLAEWRYFDRVVAPLRNTGAALLAILGNHDYYGPNRRAVVLARQRFASLQTQRWFVWRYGPLALICLDSNRWDLGSSQWREQLQWLRAALTAVDQDPSVCGVLLLCHHPPFCNSIARRESRAVRRDFQPLYVNARKAMAFISGHAHTYEHLRIDTHHYIVTGGGGGPRDTVRLPPAAKRHAVYSGEAIREFHYLLIDVDAAAVRITVKGLQTAVSPLRVIDQFALPWPSG